MADPVFTKLGPVATGGGVSAGTITVTLNRDQDAGTILVVDSEGNGATSAAVTDSRGGNTYQSDLAATGHNRCVFSSSSKPASLLKSGDVVTITFNGPVTDRNAVVYQVTNLDQTAWAAGSANNFGTSAATDSGNVTALDSTKSYCVHGVCGYNNGGGAYTAGNDGHAGTLTKLDEGSNGSAFHLATESGLSVTGQTTYKATGTVTSTSWVQAVVVYNVAAAGATISKTPSGGPVLGGSVSRTETKAPAPSGGPVLGGSTARTETKAPAPSGGLALGGGAARTAAKAAAPAGGLVLGGSSSRAETKSSSPAGGVALGGSAAVAATRSSSPSGGLVLGGSAAVTRTASATVSGGVVLAGSAAAGRVRAFEFAGGLVLGGASERVPSAVYGTMTLTDRAASAAVAADAPSALAEVTDSPSCAAAVRDYVLVE